MNFIVSYEISTGLMGAPTLRADLVISPTSTTVTGHGTVTTDSPGFNVDSRLNGDFTYLTVMPNNTHILVTAQGSAPATSPNQPLEILNLRLRMILESDWATGSATFAYVDANGNWVAINNAKVTKVNSNTTAPSAADALVSQN